MFVLHQVKLYSKECLSFIKLHNIQRNVCPSVKLYCVSYIGYTHSLIYSIHVGDNEVTRAVGGFLSIETLLYVQYRFSYI